MRIGSVLQMVTSRLRAFPKATRGNIGMILGLALVPLCLAAGTGLDMSRAMITRARMGSALDAAGLAVGSAPGMSLDDMTKLANQYFQQNYTADKSAYGAPAAVTVDRPAGSQTITLRTSVAMPTVLMRIVPGLDYMQVAATSEITWGQTKLWVALVLDNTGSMCNPPSTASNPCPTPSTQSKMYALKQATHNLLGMLQNAAANPGDVRVSIVPFAKDVNVGTSYASQTWIDWTDWDSAPPNSLPSINVGPGSNCPWSTGSNGYNCTNGPSNGASTTSKVPSSGSYTGYICPSVHSTDASTGLGGHYYNGCYNSISLPSPPVTGNVTTNVVCSKSSSCTTTSYCSNYPKITTNTSGNVTTKTTTECACVNDGGNGKKTCTTTKTPVTTTLTWSHTWIKNAHSTWSGCIMDRKQDYDVTNDAPSGGNTNFPAENAQSCTPSPIIQQSYDWTALGNQVDAMIGSGATNQVVGLAWGWATLNFGLPASTSVLTPPEDTQKVLIILSDGLNTQSNTVGDGSNQATAIDDREKLVCDNIKADHTTIYTVFVDLNGAQGSSAALADCATGGVGGGKYFDLNAASQIANAFKEIGTEITNLRVSL